MQKTEIFITQLRIYCTNESSCFYSMYGMHYHVYIPTKHYPLSQDIKYTCQTNSAPPHAVLVPHFRQQIDQEETRSRLVTLGKAICHPVPNWTAVFSQDYLSHIQMFLDLNIHKNSL